MTVTNVRYIVEDIPSAIEFYTGLLGFEVQMHPAPGFVCLKKGPLQLFLNQSGAGGAGQAMPDGRFPEPGGWNRIQLEVDDLKALYETLRAKQAVFRSPIIEGKGGKQAVLEDPSGNPVELFEPKNGSVSSGGYRPEGYAAVTPYLAIRQADELVNFLKEVSDAKEHRIMRGEDGSFLHGEIRIGDSLIMIGDVQDRYEPFPGMLKVYVPDVDETYQKALEEGATSVEEPADQDYGDRRAAFSEPSGNRWCIASKLETESLNWRNTDG